MLNRLLTLVLAPLAFGVRAHADLPAIVDAVPADARAALVIPSVNDFDEAASQLLIAMEQPEASTPRQLLKILGIAGAIDPRRPVALFYRPGPGEHAPPMLAALVPTLNAPRAMESLRADKGDHDVWSFQVGERTWYARALTDTDLIVGFEPRSLASYTPATGQLPAHERAMGPGGLAAAENADLLMWGHAEEFRPLVRRWITDAGASVQQIKGGLGGAPTPGADALCAFVETLVTSLADDADRFTLAARADANGVVAHLATSFTPGSALDGASRADRAVEPRPMFQGLPALPYLLALFVDASHEGVRALAARSLDPSDESPTMFHAADSFALAAYEPPGPLIIEGGLSRVLIRWTGEDPAQAAAWFKGYIKSLHGAQGASTSYDEQTGQIAGVTVDRWAMSIPSTGARSAQLLYGQHGSPRGVVALRERDGYISSAPDELITNLLKGRAAGDLSSNAQIREISAWLPPDPVAQAYLNFRPMLMQAVPMLAMMGVNLDVPLRLPPLAASISLKEGQAHAGAFVPAYALKLAWQFHGAYTAANAPPPSASSPAPRPGVNPSRDQP